MNSLAHPVRAAFRNPSLGLAGFDWGQRCRIALLSVGAVSFVFVNDASGIQLKTPLSCGRHCSHWHLHDVIYIKSKAVIFRLERHEIPDLNLDFRLTFNTTQRLFRFLFVFTTIKKWKHAVLYRFFSPFCSLLVEATFCPAIDCSALL